MSNKTINPWEWDVRVRERNLKRGLITEKDLEKHVRELPDRADESEPVGATQPALGGREP